MAHPLSTALSRAEQKTETSLTDAQRASGKYTKGTLDWKGLKIAVETPKGEIRTGTGKDGKRWFVEMPATYGELLRTEGRDGDPVDVYLGNDHASRKVFVVDQKNAESGRFDEHKCFLGFPDKRAVTATYEKAFSDGKARDRLGEITELSVEDFKHWLKAGDTKQPMSKQKPNREQALIQAYAPKGYATGGRVGYEDGGAAGEVVRDLERGVLPRNYKRVRANRALAGQEMRPMEADRYADYLAMEPIIRGRRMEAFDEGANAAALARAFLPNPDVLVPREGAERAGPDIRRRQQDQLMRGVPLSPQQDAERETYLAGLPARRELKANELDEGATAGRFANEALPFAMPGIGRGLRSGLGAGAEFVGGQLARMSPTTRAAVPLAGAVPAFAAMGATEAGAESKEQIKARQEKLSAAGFYKGAIDGDDGVATKEAQRMYDTSQAAREERELQRMNAMAGTERAKAEAERARAELEREKNKSESERLGEQRRKEGNERQKAAEENVGPINRILRDYGPMAGYAVGALGGFLSKKGVVGVSDALSKNKATRANELIAGPESKDAAQRVADLNQFWSEGQAPRMFGSRTMPYEVTTTGPGFKPTTGKVTPSGDLYTPSYASRAGNIGTDLGVGLGFGTEYAAVEHLIKPELEKELASARAAVKEDPSEANIGRLQAALNSASAAQFFSNAGRAAGLTYLGSGIHHTRTPTRPNISNAEAERIRINELLAQRYGSEAPGKGGPPPPTPPPVAGPPPPTGPSGSMNGAGTPPQSAPNGAGYTPPPVPPQTNASPSPSKVASQSNPELPSWAMPAPENVRLPKNAHLDEATGRVRRLDGTLGPAPIYSIPKKGKKSDKVYADDVPSKPPRVPTDEDPGFRAQGGIVARTMALARRYATGGKVVPHGLMAGGTPGRADKLPISVPSGAYVIPSDVVSATGEGNTIAGAEAFKKMLPPPSHHDASALPVDIKISDGEIVVSPSQVAALGNGSMEEGHRMLDALVKQIRAQHIETLRSLPGPAQG